MLGVGVMEALVDVGGNTLIVWVHRERVGPYMNGLHLFFAIGALLSPLLIAAGLALGGGITLGYWFLALLLVPVAFRLLPLDNPPPIVSRREHAGARPNIALLALFALAFVMVAGAENSFAGWIATYAVKTGFANPERAALLNSAFWASFMVGRLVSIPLAARLRPRMIVAADLLFGCASIGIILLFPASEIALWGGTLFFGVAIASAFPTLLTFAGRHLTITGAVTSWFFVGASIGSMTLPWLIGQLFEQVSPLSVLWIVGSALLAGLGVFGLILGLINRNAIVSKNP
jgi:fucose permease